LGEALSGLIRFESIKSEVFKALKALIFCHDYWAEKSGWKRAEKSEVLKTSDF
jgi:hypothetical protein